MGHKIRTGFGVGIGIITVQLILLLVAFISLYILIYFIGGDIYNGTNTRSMPYRLQQIHSPHDICLKCIPGIFIGFPYKRLGRHMYNNIRGK